MSWGLIEVLTPRIEIALPVAKHAHVSGTSDWASEILLRLHMMFGVMVASVLRDCHWLLAIIILYAQWESVKMIE